MPYLVLLLVSISLQSAFAKCRVYIPEKEFNYHGYSIHLDFTQMLTKKNYKEVVSLEQADFQLNLRGIERVGQHFHHAVGLLELIEKSGTTSYTAQESVRCYTQLCALSDYGNAFKKSYQKLEKNLPFCRK
jgi:hypothetical protein